MTQTIKEYIGSVMVAGVEIGDYQAWFREPVQYWLGFAPEEQPTWHQDKRRAYRFTDPHDALRRMSYAINNPQLILHNYPFLIVEETTIKKVSSIWEEEE